MRAQGLAAALLLAGCGAAPVAPPPEPPAPPAASAAPARSGPPIQILAAPPAVFNPAPRAPFATPGAVAGKGETLADWIEPAFDADRAYPSARIAAVGLWAALIRRGGALYAAHLDRGVTGPLAVPAGVFWVGLDSEDAMFAARPDGTLFRAGDLGRAIDAAGFTPIAALPDAVAWDASDHLLVAAGGRWAFASTDGGRDFRWTALPEGFVAAQIAARPDGIVVVLGHEGGDARRPMTLVSRDRGASFHPSVFHPFYLWREGARIIGEQGKCSAALSTDGESWAMTSTSTSYQERHRWERMLDTGDARSSRPRERVITLRDPPAPPPPSASMRVGPGCPPEEERPKGDGSLGGIFGTIGAGGLGGLGREDAGVLGLAGTAPRWPAESRTAWAFVGDGARVARLDRREGTLAVIDAPAGCTSEHLWSARGTGVLVCAPESGARAVYLAGRDGRWYGEGAIRCDAGEVRFFGAELDGTLALRCGQAYDGNLALWVRRPAPLGTPDAFRRVQLPGAVTYRLLDGGRAVAVTTRGARELHGIGLGSIGRRRTLKAAPPPSPAASRERHTFSVMLDAPSGTSALARDLFVAEDVEALSAHGDTLYFRLESKAHASRFVKLDKGRLQAAPPAEVPAEIRPEPPGPPPRSPSFALSIPAPGAIALDATHVYFTDTGTGRVMRVPKRGGAPEVLGSGMAGPLAVAVDDARAYVTTIGEAYGKGGGVIALPKAGGAATVLADKLVRPMAVVADQESVFWLEQGLDQGANGALFRLDKRGGSPVKVIDRLASPRSIAVDAAHVYVGQDNGDVLAVPRAGGPAQRVGSRGDGVPALVAANGGALWIAGREGFVAGGAGEIVGRARFEPDALAVRGDEIFLVHQAGGRLARTRAGQDRSEILSEELISPTSIAADESGLFVREHDGRRVRRFGRDGGSGTVIYERK